VLRHRLAVEIRELAQGVAVGDALAQFAIIPVLDTCAALHWSRNVKTLEMWSCRPRGAFHRGS
jgi:hypothetical protein